MPGSSQMALSVIGADSPMRISAAARRGADRPQLGHEPQGRREEAA